MQPNEIWHPYVTNNLLEIIDGRLSITELGKTMKNDPETIYSQLIKAVEANTCYYNKYKPSIDDAVDIICNKCGCRLHLCKCEEQDNYDNN